MGKISDKSSYKNIKAAVKSSQLFIAKQAATGLRPARPTKKHKA